MKTKNALARRKLELTAYNLERCKIRYNPDIENHCNEFYALIHISIKKGLDGHW